MIIQEHLAESDQIFVDLFTIQDSNGSDNIALLF